MDIPKELLAALVFLALCNYAVFSQDTDNDADFQREARGRNEREYTRREDEEFDRTVGNSVVRPRGRPTRNQVRNAYQEQKNDLIRSAHPSDRQQMRDDSRSMTFNPYVEFLSSNEWKSITNNLTCCPPAWNYGCTSERVPMPCFLYSNGNRNQWCCPYWPDLTIKKCKCRRCAILKPKCAKEGKCQRRYREKKFYAVCYQNSAWSKIRYVEMYLPTSCYCLANN